MRSDEPNGAIMLSTLRRDGFMGMATEEGAEGVLTTAAFALRSPWLFLNLAAAVRIHRPRSFR